MAKSFKELANKCSTPKSKAIAQRRTKQLFKQMKTRFNDPVMQRHYESLIKDGYHWRTAERKTIKTFQEYDDN